MIKLMGEKQGFTIIELLIVVSVISILASISAVTYTQLQKNSRDTRRQSDLRLIQSNLEQYRADQGFYPSSVSSSSPLDANTGSDKPPIANPKVYSRALPSDPLTTNQYNYRTIPGPCDNGSANRCQSYCLYATMENTTNANSHLVHCPDRTGEGFNYEVPAP